MSFENYVTGLMKNPAPSFGDRLVLHLLEKLEKVHPVSYTHLTLPTICSV